MESVGVQTDSSSNYNHISRTLGTESENDVGCKLTRINAHRRSSSCALALLMLSAPGPAMAVRKPLIHVSYAYIMVLTCALPVAGLFGVVLIGYYLHFDGVTRTHCKVRD